MLVRVFSQSLGDFSLMCLHRSFSYRLIGGGGHLPERITGESLILQVPFFEVPVHSRLHFLNFCLLKVSFLSGSPF